MSWVITHAASATPVTVSPLTVTYAGVAGRLYSLFLSRAVANEFFSTVTDTGGNTWTKREDTPDSGTVGRRLEIWDCVPVSSFTSITAAFAGTGQAQGTLVEIRGFESSGFLDTSFSIFRAASTTPAAASLTPSIADTLVLSAIQANSNLHTTQVSVPAGWTDLVGYNSAGPKIVYQINPPAGVALGAAFVLNTSTGSGLGTIGYKMDTIVTAIGRVGETGTVNAVTSIKSKAIGQVTETGSVNAVTSSKVKAISPVTETETVNAVTSVKAKAIGQVTETGSVNPASSLKTKSISQVIETGSVGAVTSLKIQAIGLIIGTETVNAVTSLKSVTVGLIEEDGTVFAVTSIRGTLVGQVLTTESVFPVTSAKSKSIGLVTEVGSVFSVASPGIVSSIGLVVEYGIVCRIGPPLEINTYVTLSVGTTDIEIAAGETSVAL